MERILIILSRVVWAVWGFSWAWALCTGNAVRPLHPFNLVSSCALVAGSICIWISRPWARLISAIAGLVVPTMLGFQFFVIAGMFSNEAQMRMTYGPFQFEGSGAWFVFICPTVILIFASAWRLWLSACEIDKRNETIA